MPGPVEQLIILFGQVNISSKVFFVWSGGGSVALVGSQQLDLRGIRIWFFFAAVGECERVSPINTR